MQLVRVAVSGHVALDRAAMVALVRSMPGFTVVESSASPPPEVLVWLCHGDHANWPQAVDTSAARILVVGDALERTLPEQVGGLISREEDALALAIAIRQVARGEAYFSPAIVLRLLERNRSNAQSSNGHKDEQDLLRHLTARERDVLILLAQGLNNKEIAARLYISIRTVGWHLANIYTSLGVRSRTEAALFANKHHSGLSDK